MPLAPNGTLAERHSPGTRLPLPTIVTYVKQVAGALQYMHDNGYIHRNVKPESMLLGESNEILLSSFVIATSIQNSSEKASGKVSGTARYMAPERFEGKSSPASDQYSLGITVYEWCGTLPFSGTFNELRRQHLFTAPPSLCAKDPTIPIAVEQVVVKALAKNPRERFASVQEFADALEQVVASKLVGRQLGKYHLVRLLGLGDFAQVYLGEHISLKTQVAVKVLRTYLGEDELKRFSDEAHILARLKHPNIIRFVDFSERGEIPFLIMELAPKGTLREKYPRGTRLPLATSVAYVKQIASALQYMHDKDYIHRDVNPENILLGQNNEVLLGGFGLVISIQDKSEEFVGTIPYAAPEQLQGKPLPASDQYALGIVTYEWLCGKRPFAGNQWELINQQLSASPPSLRAQYPELPMVVEQVVLRALAKNPQERFGRVEEFADALEQAYQVLQQFNEVLQQTKASLQSFVDALKQISGSLQASARNFISGSLQELAHILERASLSLQNSAYSLEHSSLQNVTDGVFQAGVMLEDASTVLLNFSESSLQISRQPLQQTSQLLVSSIEPLQDIQRYLADSTFALEQDKHALQDTAHILQQVNTYLQTYTEALRQANTSLQLGEDDILMTLSISAVEALNGTTRQVKPQEQGHTVTVTIPANAHEGQVLRLEEKGKRPNLSSRAGKLFVQIHIEQEGVVSSSVQVKQEDVDSLSTPSASPDVEPVEKIDSPSSLVSDVRSAEPLLTSPTITYQIFLATSSSTPITIGNTLEVSLYLSPVSDNDNTTGYRFELPRNEAVGGELNILLTASGFQFISANAGSLPMEVPTEEGAAPAPQVARFTLVALRPGTAKVSAEVYNDSNYLTNLEADVEVLSVEEDYSADGAHISVHSCPVPQPDIILQVQTEWNTDVSACTLRYVLNSFHRSSSIHGGDYRSPSLSTGWVERSQRLLGSVLEECVDGQPEDVRARLASFGYYLFQSVFPLVLQHELRNLAHLERTLTLLILADQDAWLPWEVLHTGQAFLGEQFVIGRWMRELDEARPYEFPVGGVHVAHYANVPQPEMWVDLLTFPDIPEPLLLPVFADLEAAEAMRGLHLIRYGHPPGPIDLQDAPMMLNMAKSNGSVEAEFRPAKLSLRRNRPLVSLGYVSAGQPELTALEQAWAPTFVRAGCSAFVGPMWAVQPTVQAAFVSGFYSRLWAGDSLAGALQMGRRLAKAAAPDSLDWLAYVLFGDPMACPYRPVQGQGYALVEPIGREMDDPVPAGGSARFRVSLRRTPPVWHEERVIEVAETLNFDNLQVYVVTFGLDVIPSPPIEMRKLTPDGDYLGWFNLSVPSDITAREVRVQVHFEDGMQPIHSLTFTLRLAIQGGDTR